MHLKFLKNFFFQRLPNVSRKEPNLNAGQSVRFSPITNNSEERPSTCIIEHIPQDEFLAGELPSQTV